MKKLFILSITSVLVLCGCNKKTQEVTPIDPEDTPMTEPYKDEVRKLHEGAATTKDITLRFFKEYQHIPYIDLDFYMEEFYFLNLEKEVNGDVYHYYKNSISLTVDVANDTFTVSDIDKICNLNQFSYIVCYGQNGSSQIGEVEDKIFDFKQYDIDLREGDNKAYLPLVTLNNIFSWVFGYSVSYNGKDVYILNASGEVYEDAGEGDYADYYSVINNKTSIYSDEAKFNYSELCFSIDQLTGHPETMNIGRDELEEKGLDVVLNSYPTLKQGLKSNNLDTYLAAQYLFHSILMYDGGHAGAYVYPSDYDIAMNILYADSKLLQKQEAMWTRSQEKNKAYNGALDYRPYTGSLYFHREGNIAYIGFNSFNANYEGWYEYYMNDGELPEFSTDTMMFIYHFLDVISNDGGIDNVVLDITCNGGGDVMALDGVLSLLVSGNIQKTVKNTINGNYYNAITKIDRNFDGYFNALDNDRKFNFNYAILTSNYSFSCGNALPTVAKDNGIMIIGEQSGGGSCYVGDYNDLFGLKYRVSGMSRIHDYGFIERDTGVPVDLDLITYNEGAKNYQRFYDAAYVSQAITEFYN